MELNIKLYVDPTTNQPIYWTRVETSYSIPAYCKNVGTGTLPLQADADGNYHLEVFLDETSQASATNPVVHIVDLGELVCANTDTTLTVYAQLVDGGGTTGTVRLEDAEQESRPDHE